MRKFISREALIEQVGLDISEQYYRRICEDFDACCLSVDGFLETYPFYPLPGDNGTVTRRDCYEE